jgi:uncharacterized membrane protein YedE/YeeE
MLEQDWILGFIGGLMIGTAAALYLLVNGRIMGASGILGGLVDGSGSSSAAERIAFIGGLIAIPALMLPLWGDVSVVIAAGLLVGVGTRLSNGCTSGHGVCGISRLSLRGIVATVFYLLAGGLMMVTFRHVLGVI